MSSRVGRRSRSRSKSLDSRRSGHKDKDQPWQKKRKRSSSSSSSASSKSRSSRRKNQRSRSRSPVRPIMSKEPKYVSSRVHVTNLASEKVTNADLQKLFERHGKVVDTLVHHNGYGFVQFIHEEDAKKAVVKETGTMLQGKVLKCKIAVVKNSREGGDGREEREKRNGPGSGKGRARRPESHGDRRGGLLLHMPRDDRYGPRHRDLFPRDMDLPPHPRDFRDMGPPPFDRDFIPPYDRDFIPPPDRDFIPPPWDIRGPRDLPPLPRDPFYDEPFRRTHMPDPFYDRIPDDPFRRDPFRPDPFRDPLRDPFVPDRCDPVVPPKKQMVVDCEIVVTTSDLRQYADMVENRLKDINLLTNVSIIRESQSVQDVVEDAASRSCLFAIIINQQNEEHRSITLTILHGVIQEHRNMPLDDAVDLMAGSFEKFLTAEKEKLAKALKNKDQSSTIASTTTTTTTPTTTTTTTVTSKSGQEGVRDGDPHPEDMGFLLKLVCENRPVSLEELDSVIAYLQERRQRKLGTTDSKEHPPPRQPTNTDRLQEPPKQQQQLTWSQHVATSQPQYPVEQQTLGSVSQDMQTTIHKLMNGRELASTAVASSSSPQSTTLTSNLSSLLPTMLAGRIVPPPPPPPPTEDAELPLGPSSSSLSMPLSTSSVPSSAGVGLKKNASLMLDFDNPTVQKALDNLIQSGPSLLKNITTAAVGQPQGQGMWPSQGKTQLASPPVGHPQGERSLPSQGMTLPTPAPGVRQPSVTRPPHWQY